MTDKRVVLLADIDDSLITACRRAPAGGGRAVAVDNKGEVCGFLTPKQAMFFEWITSVAMLVPTTARSSKALRQVSLPFNGYAICSFGGLILTPSGAPEPRWHEQMSREAAGHHESLEQLLDFVRREADQARIDVRCSVVSDCGLDFYLSVKHNQKDGDELTRIEELLMEVLPAGWQRHRNKNNLAALPPYLDKAQAARWFVENIAAPGSLVIGLGDSLSDLPFMSLCDFALMPSASQIFSLLTKEPGHEAFSR